MPFLLLWHPKVSHETDTATVYLDLQVVSVEIAQYADDATVYLDIQPGYIYVQVDYLLQIMGLEKRWELGKVDTRFSVFVAIKRFALMLTRRTLWRF